MIKNLGLAATAILLTAAITGCSDINAAEKKKAEKETENVTVNPVASGSVNLTKEDFLKKVFDYEKNTTEWKYEGDLPCIVDFYADWCQPCKIASPILEELAREYQGKIYVYKINTEKERELAAAFGIRSIPTFMLVPMEGKPQVFSGIGQSQEATREMFKKAIDEVLIKTKTESK
ncbi:MAG: thioredoxin domain-containing protein [Bacteroidales bacterium]